MNLSSHILRKICDHASAAVMVLDAKGRIALLNAAAERLLGTPQVPVLGQPVDQILEIYHQEDPNQRLFFPIRSLLEQGETIERVNHAVLKTKQGVDIRAEISLLPFDQQGHSGALLLIHEVNKSIAPIPTPFINQETLQALITNFHHGVTVFEWLRDESGQVIDFSLVEFNPSFAALVGCNASELPGCSSAQIFKDDSSNFLKQFLKLQQGAATVQFEVFFAPTRRSFQILAFPLDNDRFVAVYNDNTPLRQAQQALERGVQIFQKFIHTVQDGILIVDLKGRIQLWNEAAERIFGYRSDEVLGKTVDELIIPKDRQRWVDEQWAQFIRHAKDSGEGITLEFECQTKHGESVPIEVSISLANVEEEWMAIAIVREIGARKAFERAIERRDAILTAVNFVAERLLLANQWQDVIDDILRELGEATKVDRVYLFKNDSVPFDGDVYVSQIYEWTAADIRPQMDNPDLQHLPLRQSGFGRWLERLSKGESLYGLITEFPISEQAILADQDIQSLAVVPVFCASHWWGFLGFDDCHNPRPWSRTEIEALRTAANLLGTAIHRQTMSWQVQTSEKKYQELVEQLPVVVYTAVADKHRTLQADYISPNMVELSGYTPEELIKDNYLWIECIHSEDRAQAIATYNRHITEQTAWEQEYRILRKDGNVVWVKEQALPILDPQSKLLRVQGVFQDISLEKRRQLEQQAIALVHQALQGDDRLQPLLERLLAAVIHAIPNGEKGSILLRNGEDQLAFGALYGYQDVRIRKIIFPLQAGYAAKAFRSRQALIIQDARGDPSIRFEGEVEEMRQVQSAIAAPLLLHDQAIGVITVDNCTRKNAFSPDDLQFLNHIASTAALVVENVRLLEEARHRVKELEVIAGVSYALRAADNHLEMVEAILEHVRSGLGMNTAALRLFDPQNQHPICEKVQGDYHHLEEFLKAFGKQTITALQKSRSAVFMEEDDYAGQEPYPRPAMVAIPLIAQDVYLGELYACRRSQISAQELHLLEMIADIAANAFYRARLHQQTEKQLQHLSTLFKIDQAISKRHDLNAILEIIVQEAHIQLGGDAIAIHLYDPQTEQLTFIAGHGFRTELIKEITYSVREGRFKTTQTTLESLYIPSIFRTNISTTHTKLFLEEGFIAYAATPLLIQNQLRGVLEVFHRKEFQPQEEWKRLFEAFASQAAIAIDNAQMFADIQRTNLQLSIAYDATLEGWAKALELRDGETSGHSNRVTELTLHIAAEMGVPNDQMIHIWRGARLHDIGKMAVPDSILLKPAPLSEGEWEIMRRHPVYAYELLAPIEYLRPALDIPYCHHERWDGSGYPRGLKGEEIPLAARIFAVVDVWDALTSDRPYRPAWDKEKSLQYIIEQRGKQFDPAVVDVFLRIIKEQNDKDKG
ncbi:MAG: hypothetical protein DDG59_02065 [Anaerolineae bacterium]|nr:MAG: hypothetical protein DDG59_02065 [Anaerolineae bacterium]